MYTFNLTSKYLTIEEQDLYADYLRFHGLDKSIWEVFACLVRTENFLNALHGAFDRSLKTIYHTYDVLFIKMIEFAIKHGLAIIDYRAVLNHTKRKMANESIDIAYFILSRYRAIQ